MSGRLFDGERYSRHVHGIIERFLQGGEDQLISGGSTAPLYEKYHSIYGDSIGSTNNPKERVFLMAFSDGKVLPIYIYKSYPKCT